MDKELGILELLKQKRSIFMKIENLTEKMKNAPVEDLKEVFENRGEALFLVGKVDKEISELALGDKAMAGVLDGSVSPDELTGAAAEIFRAALSVKAIANRVLNADPEVLQRVERERDELLARLEEMNGSAQSVVGTYKRSIQTGVSQTAYTGGNKSI